MWVGATNGMVYMFEITYITNSVYVTRDSSTLSSTSPIKMFSLVPESIRSMPPIQGIIVVPYTSIQPPLPRDDSNSSTTVINATSTGAVCSTEEYITRLSSSNSSSSGDHRPFHIDKGGEGRSEGPAIPFMNTVCSNSSSGSLLGKRSRPTWERDATADGGGSALADYDPPVPDTALHGVCKTNPKGSGDESEVVLVIHANQIYYLVNHHQQLPQQQDTSRSNSSSSSAPSTSSNNVAIERFSRLKLGQAGKGHNSDDVDIKVYDTCYDHSDTSSAARGCVWVSCRASATQPAVLYPLYLQNTTPHPSLQNTTPHPSLQNTTSHPSFQNTTPHPSLQNTTPHQSLQNTTLSGILSIQHMLQYSGHQFDSAMSPKIAVTTSSDFQRQYVAIYSTSAYFHTQRHTCNTWNTPTPTSASTVYNSVNNNSGGKNEKQSGRGYVYIYQKSLHPATVYNTSTTSYKSPIPTTSSSSSYTPAYTTSPALHTHKNDNNISHTISKQEERVQEDVLLCIIPVDSPLCCHLTLTAVPVNTTSHTTATIPIATSVTSPSPSLPLPHIPYIPSSSSSAVGVHIGSSSYPNPTTPYIPCQSSSTTLPQHITPYPNIGTVDHPTTTTSATIMSPVYIDNNIHNITAVTSLTCELQLVIAHKDAVKIYKIRV